MKRNLFSILICILLLTSCKESTPEYKFKKKVLFEKRTSLYQGNTRYEFAFNDGTSDNVSYGLYATTKPNDTIYYVKEIGFFGMWCVADKELFYKYYNESNSQE